MIDRKELAGRYVWCNLIDAPLWYFRLSDGTEHRIDPHDIIDPSPDAECELDPDHPWAPPAPMHLRYRVDSGPVVTFRWRAVVEHCGLQPAE